MEIHEGGRDAFSGRAWKRHRSHDFLYHLPWVVVKASVVRALFMVRAELDGQQVSAFLHEEVCDPDGYRPFYTYYQISREDESDAAETEPGTEGELTSRFEGSHSPFGFVWQVASATGWSVDYILNGVNYQTLIMMLSDAPRYIRNKTTVKDKAPVQEAEDIAGFFQSKLM